MRGLIHDLGTAFGLAEARDAGSRRRGDAVFRGLLGLGMAFLALLTLLSPYGERWLAVVFTISAASLLAQAIVTTVRLRRERAAQTV
jgi:ubiquinone biosynthesis protein UbiJ